MIDNNIGFELAENQFNDTRPIIKVIGVGGGGGNAVAHMHKQGIKDVELFVFNTDVQALRTNSVENKLQIGSNLLSGLGSGAQPERGREAAKESADRIREIIEDHTEMVFITAGMGKGTGSGAAPYVAQIAKELGKLTIGIVTRPFSHEGGQCKRNADESIAELKKHCDCVITILNDKLFEVYPNLKLGEAFSKTDEVLATAAQSIADIITKPNKVNMDFNDVKTMLTNAGTAVMGIGASSAEEKAVECVKTALDSPLLNDQDLTGADKILLQLSYAPGSEPAMQELNSIAKLLRERTGTDSHLIQSWGEDPRLETGVLKVTVVIAGFEADRNQYQSPYKKPIANQPKTDGEINVAGDNLKPEVADNNQVKKAIPLGSTVEIDFAIDGLSQNRNKPRTESVEPVRTAKSNLEKWAEAAIERRKSPISRDTYLDPKKRRVLETPAFRRMDVPLVKQPHSSETNISRYKLGDDNQILGNNRHLYDNVD